MKINYTKIWRWTYIIILVVIILPLFLSVVYKVVPAVSTLQIYRFVTNQSVERSWLSYAKTSTNLKRAIVVAEDSRFCDHFGVDWEELRGQLSVLESGKSPRGASTITMQLAKNLFLWHGRSYIRKAFEIPLAMWMDLVLGKQRSMEIYLNNVEWGEGLFGAEAAAQKYFHKSAQALSMREAALLAVSLPNPKIRNPSKPTSFMREQSGKIMYRMSRTAPNYSCLSE